MAHKLDAVYNRLCARVQSEGYIEQEDVDAIADHVTELEKALEAERDALALQRRKTQNVLDDLAERTREWAELKKQLAKVNM